MAVNYPDAFPLVIINKTGCSVISFCWCAALAAQCQRTAIFPPLSNNSDLLKIIAEPSDIQQVQKIFNRCSFSWHTIAAMEENMTTTIKERAKSCTHVQCGQVLLLPLTCNAWRIPGGGSHFARSQEVSPPHYFSPYSVDAMPWNSIEIEGQVETQKQPSPMQSDGQPLRDL